jgi:hypothetical protein
MANVFSFSSGGIVYVTTTSGAVYEGQFLGLRHHDDDHSLQEIQYLYIKLTAATDPYSIGVTIALNSTLIESIGPVSF